MGLFNQKAGSKSSKMGKPHYKKKDLKIVYAEKWGVELRKQIRKRDGYRCCNCGMTQKQNKEKLTVHHIDYDKKNSVPGNLISLCWKCHKKAHPKAEGRKKECIAKFKDMLGGLTDQYAKDITFLKKSPAVKQINPMDDELSIENLKKTLKEMFKDVAPKKMRFYIAYITNGFNGRKAYQELHPHVAKNTAEVMAARWLKDISLPELLKISGFGFDSMREDLAALTPERRLYFLMKFYKLDHTVVEQVGKMEVTILPPPKPDPIVIEGPPEVIVKKKKTTKKQGSKGYNIVKEE